MSAQEGSRPGLGGVKRVFDSHCHIIDPRFPLIENNGYLPPDFTVTDYRQRTAALGITGGAVVSGSFQGFDQEYLIDALRQLGPGFVGVTQLPASVTEEEVARLDAHGVRAVRFNVRRGGSETLSHLDTLARRVHEVAGWHTELYIDARDLPVLLPTLRSLPALSVDHLGLSDEGLTSLLHLVENGTKVKATGFGRVDLDVDESVRAVVKANPQALMFGTDLPSTRARRPFDDGDLHRLADLVGGENVQAVLWDNAAAHYRTG
ncbi:amidohydrolase family protein [Streptomyces sp. NPDC101227]|uniref:amidohydrolase family protein n=1 Tax=Streptomyces sp. NPDC101227 TaxID=3366136 RepID=UPI00382EA391